METVTDIKRTLATGGDQLLGALCMWTLGGLCIPRMVFGEAMEALGLAVPRTPRPITIARAAVVAAQTGRRQSVLVRQIVAEEDRVIWGVVYEQKDRAKVELSHRQATRIALFPATGALEIEDADDEISRAVKAEYERRRDHVLTADVTAVVVDALVGAMRGLRLAGRGGAYFVRAEHLPTLRRLGAYLESQGEECLFTILEIAGTGENVAQAGRRAHVELAQRVREVVAEAREFAATLRAKDSVATVPERVIETRLRRFREIEQAGALYADLLGDLRGSLVAQLAEAREAVMGLGDAPELDDVDPFVIAPTEPPHAPSLAPEGDGEASRPVEPPAPYTARPMRMGNDGVDETPLGDSFDDFPDFD